jgi:regulation of enolase protein 1 (concanavalin A-like superfamily)
MRNRAIWLTGALLIGLILSGSGQAQQITNLFQNPGFETGVLTPWGSYGGGGATVTSTVVTDCIGATVPEGPIEGKYCLNVKVSGPGTNFWDGAVSPVLISGQGIFRQGKKYTLSLFFKCKSGTATINLKPELAQDPWTGYGETQVTATEKWAEYHTTTPVFSADVNPAHVTFHVEFKAQEFWIDDVKWYEGDYVPTQVKSKRSAGSPTPDDKATDIPSDPMLSWKAGPFAATHNVYLGTSFDDVNTADLSKAVGKNQTDTAFKVTDPLEYGTTYYWRVDEVNAAPSSTVFKGDVWSFTVEPYAYPIPGASITATASSQDKSTTGPANTINGSGLTGDLHATASDTMWVSSMTGTTPVWIQYQFDKVYKLQELWVWNHNTEMEPVLGYGFKDVTIETSTDGTTWTALKDVQFARAAALAGYAHNTTVDLGGVMARYVRLTANSNWSMIGLKACGLSEVRFYYIPVEARAPQPGQYAENVAVNASLDWRPGRDVTSHTVVFGADKAAVAAGTAASKSVTAHGFAPSALEFGTTYYWKVDEVGTATYPGSIWSFTTQQFATVEDFETYTDKVGEEIFTAWVDGYTNGNGSLVGYINASGGTFGEVNIVHSGKQSMPFEYNNVKTPYYSEAERTFDTTQDWTVSGANSLALWYMGYPTGFADKGNNAFTVSSAGSDIWGNGDQFRFIYKQITGDGSVTVKVDSLTRSDAWSKAGVMIRETLEANAKNAMVAVTPDNSCAFQWRTNTGGASSNTGWPTGTAAVRAPYWVRITRTGNDFKAESSPDGKTWTALGTAQNITMAATAYIGLAVTSHNTAAYSTAELSNVSTSGTVTGAWQNLSIGVTQWSNGAAPLYVTVTDKAGKSKTVVNPNPAAVNASVWTQWQIAFNDLSGVNLAAVKKLTIGVGDRANPKAGAAGMLYFDDIGFGKPIIPVGLVAAYSFENDVKDSSGNGHDGTILGTVTYVDGPTGKGKAVLFPGTPGNAVNLGTFNPSEKSGMLSVSLWAKWNGLSNQWQGLIGKRDTWTADQTMWQVEASQTSGALSFARYGLTAGTAPALKVGEWAHIAVTFDKTTARFYVNGVQTGSGAFSFGPDREAALQIGQDSADGNAFNGALDEVKLYDIVLTPAEILALAGK